MTTDAPESTTDLYAVLGVHRDASPLAIRQAYRAKAKDYHPDNTETGDKAKFNQLRLARDVLTNPRWRENYDAVGAIPEDEADNEQAQVITVATGILVGTTNAILGEQKDPTRGDLVAAMQAYLKGEFEKVNRQITDLQTTRQQVSGLAGRFKVKSFEHPNHLETIVQGQIAQLDKQLDGLAVTLRQLETLRIYLNDISYRFDA